MLDVAPCEWLADAIFTIHRAFVAFVVVGSPITLIGLQAKWPWVFTAIYTSGTDGQF